ncbi:trans-aconitate 2-methyltransferase [Folsomia candida]|uniref:Malonyl-[acyl-carrier protein] O-methyltransferase n=1 Tax=Folsomia candida TaxID=158441 RepID=A0A226DQZ6_FOLCA|nr:trans-aconitate 2-methyltransferase [Folsomia candida]OXA47490.1 Malonyl-[acyl-carrier protein] O-methyltransferase [Folsomia candida]
MDITQEACSNRNSMRFEEGKQLIGQILSDFPTRKFPIILDIGCGSGNLTHVMAKLLLHETIFGIDSDPDMVTVCQNSNSTTGTIKYLCQDISQPWDQLAPELTQLAGQVDLIVSNMTLHWVTDLDTACKNMETLLKPGGAFYFNIFGINPISISQQQYLKHKSVANQIFEMVGILHRNELEVGRAELFYNRWPYAGKEFDVLAPIMYKMYYNLIDEAEFSKLDKIGQDEVRQEIRNGVHAAYAFDVENEAKNYVVGSGDSFCFCYYAFTIQGGKMV